MFSTFGIPPIVLVPVTLSLSALLIFFINSVFFSTNGLLLQKSDKKGYLFWNSTGSCVNCSSIRKDLLSILIFCRNSSLNSILLCLYFNIPIMPEKNYQILELVEINTFYSIEQDKISPTSFLFETGLLMN